MKFMIMNYKPYEYELLQEKLDKLGKQGYSTNDLSFISFFRKKDKPVYYTIDFFNPTGSSRNDIKISQLTFIDKYEDKGYRCIYHKNNMYVFLSNNDIPLNINWKEKKDIIPLKQRLKSFALFFVSIVALAVYSLYLFNATFDMFYSYGITLYYIGMLLLFIIASLKNYFDFYKLTQFHKELQSGKPQLKKIYTLKKVYNISLIIMCLLIGGGLLEDFTNNHPFNIKTHQVIQLDDFGYQQNTNISTQSYSSFTIPHTYISLETSKNTNEALYIKEFAFHSYEMAKKIFEQMKENPEIYSCNSQKSNKTTICGYIGDSLTSIVILHDQQVTIIIPGFEVNESHVEIIEDFYLK